jgi:PhzF family phenazine biosynthesis protein
MPTLNFLTVDVFAQTRYAGNPLAIVKVPAGHDVPSDKMLAIAKEFNLSETVFLHEDVKDDGGAPEWRFRIFMTEMELYARHPYLNVDCESC